MVLSIERIGVGLVLAVGLAIVNAGSDWRIVPEHDLAVFEAFEYSIFRINEIRERCGLGLRLARLAQGQYTVTEAYRKDFGLFAEFLLHIQAKDQLAPIEIRVHIAREMTATDLSVFEIMDIDPLPCALYSELDDAELMVSPTGAHVERAKEVTLKELNRVRTIVCPKSPPLEVVRLISAALQAVEGKLVRLVIEFRESSINFATQSFVDVVMVLFTPDMKVPGDVTTTTEVYPSKRPCDLKYTQGEESALSRRLFSRQQFVANSSLPVAAAVLPWDRRHGGRNLESSTAKAYRTADDYVVRNFIDKGFEIPDDFDPRRERTLCFPRGISRRQGSCGASWAFAATAVASFRECLWHLHSGIPSAGLHFLSAQELVSCLGREGCSGGDAGSAFYYMKQNGLARESCSPYRMRCFVDNSVVSVGSADLETSQPKSEYHDGRYTCPVSPKLETSPCKCLPPAFHASKPVHCEMLPMACERTQVPHYFRILGTSEGNTVQEVERHMMQEMISDGPLYVSLLIFDDFFDPAAWTESGIYIHRDGDLVGKHAVVAVGWGTDTSSRDYWLLLNSMGRGWQQEGYFKVARGETSLEIMTFGAWGVDMSEPDTDRSKPRVSNAEVSFSLADKISDGGGSGFIWLQVAADTDEPARVRVEVKGLSSGVAGVARSSELERSHVLRIDLGRLRLLGERTEIVMWATDAAGNRGRWGPLTFNIPTLEAFKEEQSANSDRRLAVPVFV